MKNVIITDDRREEFGEPKKLYWGEREGSDWEYRVDGEQMKELTDFYDWGYYREHRVEGNGNVALILECLLKDENISYFTDYEEEEILDEVADDWNGVAEYLFWGSGLKITGEQAKKAFDFAKGKEKDEVLEELVSIFAERTCRKFVSRGYCQGDVCEVFVLEPAEPAEDEMECFEAVVGAYLWGCYDYLRLLNENGDELVRAVVLDFTPKKDLGKTWDAKREAERKSLLDELEMSERKVGTAEGHKVYDWSWDFTEPSE